MSGREQLPDELWIAYSHWRRVDALARELRDKPGHEEQARKLREYSEELLQTALLREALRIRREEGGR